MIKTALDSLLSISTSDAEGNEELSTLVRRTLTSLVHHVMGPTQLVPVTQILVDALRQQLGVFMEVNLASRNDLQVDNVTKLKRTITALETPCIVRKGVRIPQAHLSSILSLLSSASIITLSLIPHEFASLLISTLTGAGLSTWMVKENKSVFENVWEIEEGLIGLRVAGALAEAEWDGWSTMILPGVLKSVYNECTLNFPLCVPSYLHHNVQTGIYPLC